MKSRSGRVKDWCRSVAIIAVATSIIAVILNMALHIAPHPETRDRVANRSGERPASGPRRIGVDRPTKAPRPARRGKDPIRRAEETVEVVEHPEEPPAADAVGLAPPKVGPPSPVADSKETVEVPRTEAVKPRKSRSQWQKDLLILHKNRFHPRRGSESAKRQARDKGEAELAAIDDPNAARAIWDVFVGGADHHHLMSLTLGRIDCTESTKALAALSIYSPDEKARRLAAKALRTRDPKDFVEPLSSVFASLLKYRPEWIAIPGQGRVQVLFIEGERANYQFLYPSPEQNAFSGLGTGIYRHQNAYMNVEQRRMAAAYNQALTSMARNTTKAQLDSDIKEVRRLNQRIDAMNNLAVGVLRGATGGSLPPEREAWRRWLAQHEGYAYVAPVAVPKPTIARSSLPCTGPTSSPCLNRAEGERLAARSGRHHDRSRCGAGGTEWGPAFAMTSPRNPRSR